MFTNIMQDKIDECYNHTKDILGEKFVLIDSMIGKLDQTEQFCMKFIYANLPISDIGDYSFETFLSFTKHSLMLKEKMPWGKKIPEEIFLAEVLFPRINDEKIEDHRSKLFKIFYPYIAESEDIYDAVIKANYASVEYGSYRSPSRRTVSPLTFIKRTFGRCGEESTFLVSLLRSLGIPARQIYTPRWAHCDDNHAWVEAWCEDGWHYLGACEPEPFLDKGWFSSASQRAMLLHYRVFDNTQVYDGKITNDGPVTTVNCTDFYAETKNIKVKVLNEKLPVENAVVSFEIINYSEFAPLSQINTNIYGEASLNTGIGSILVHVYKDGKSCQRLIEPEFQGELIFDFSEFEQDPFEKVKDFDFYAPIGGSKLNKQLTAKEIEVHKQKLKLANEIRIKSEIESVVSIDEYKNKSEYISKEKLQEVLDKAKHNGKEVVDFLNLAKNSLNAELLFFLDDKDLVDLDSEIMLDHVNSALEYKEKYPKEIFEKYLLCPRMSYEEITPYRSFVKSFFTELEIKEFLNNPIMVWEYLENNISYTPEKNFNSLIASLETILTLREASSKSKEVATVAILRSLGIAARLNQLTSKPEFWRDGEFVSAVSEKIEMGRLTIDSQDGVKYVYHTNWSIAKLEGCVYRTLEFSGEISEMKDFPLEVGKYRIITTNRLPNGNTYNRQYIFEIEKEITTCLEIEIRDINFEETFLNIKLADFMVSYKKEATYISKILKDRLNFVLWLGEGEEPTEHIINELIEAKEILSELEVNVVAVIRDESAIENESIKKLMQEITKVDYCIDQDFYIHESVARGLFVDPGQLPLAMVCSEQLKAIYASCGYNVGSVELMIQIYKTAKGV